MESLPESARARRAFTIVELLVALVIMGVAGTGLASALTGDRRLRNLAAAHEFAADRARERLEWLAALPCAPGAAGTSSSPWGLERWNASLVQSAWQLADSLVLTLDPPAAPVVIDATIACPE
jgi:prepilin-type N-terminal cleavage/methylation domain-containing protein